MQADHHSLLATPKQVLRTPQNNAYISSTIRKPIWIKYHQFPATRIIVQQTPKVEEKKDVALQQSEIIPPIHYGGYFQPFAALAPGCYPYTTGYYTFSDKKQPGNYQIIRTNLLLEFKLPNKYNGPTYEKNENIDQQQNFSETKNKQKRI